MVHILTKSFISSFALVHQKDFLLDFSVQHKHFREINQTLTWGLWWFCHSLRFHYLILKLLVKFELGVLKFSAFNWHSWLDLPGTFITTLYRSGSTLIIDFCLENKFWIGHELSLIYDPAFLDICMSLLAFEHKQFRTISYPLTPLIPLSIYLS